MKTTAKVQPVMASDFQMKGTGPRFSAKQLKHIRAMAYERACLMRAEGKWTPEEESAYLNGVMSAFHACGCADLIPAFWIMSPNRLLDNLEHWKAEGKKLI